MGESDVPESLPNLLFIGPNKAGSTWLYELLDWHPQTYVPPAKEIYFFDFYFDRGTDWYASQFRNAPTDAEVRADISHDYLFNEHAPRRVSETLGTPMLMLTLREPVSRAFSEYLYRVRQGRSTGSFEDAIRADDSILSHSRYAEHLAHWLDVFDRDRFIFTVFDDLRENSGAFATSLFGQLGVEQLMPPPEVLAPSLVTARARNDAISRLATRGSVLARNLGLARLVSQVKGNPSLQRLLFREWDDAPRPDPELAAELRREFSPGVRQLDEITGLDLADRWGY